MKLNIGSNQRSLTLEELSLLDKSKGKSYETEPSDKSIALVSKSLPPKEKDPDDGTGYKRDRFYLPILNLNDPKQWESKPLSERKFFTDTVAKETCVGNCCGVEGLSAGCCQLDPDDIEHVLGPVDEVWIKKTIKWFNKKGLAYTRHDIVIDFEEGKLIGQTFFKDHPVFSRKETYPILRIQASGVRFACKFLNVLNGKCTIYLQRPDMCSRYLCSYVKTNFLVRGESHPNTYKKVL